MNVIFIQNKINKWLEINVKKQTIKNIGYSCKIKKNKNLPKAITISHKKKKEIHTVFKKIS